MKTFVISFSYLPDFASWIQRHQYNSFIILETLHRVNSGGITLIQVTYVSYSEYY